MKYSEINTKDELWEEVSELVFKKSFTEFVIKCYQGVQDKWKQVSEREGGPIEN